VFDYEVCKEGVYMNFWIIKLKAGGYHKHRNTMSSKNINNMNLKTTDKKKATEYLDEEFAQQLAEKLNGKAIEVMSDENLLDD